MKNRYGSILMILILLVMFPALAQADRWYVDGDVLVSGDGTSWGQAFKFIWEATQFAAQDGDEVWIKKGTYTPISPILVITACEIYGGFGGGETDINQRSWQINQTIVDGSDAIYHCFDISDSATFDGLIITGGNANGGSTPANLGGGMYIKNNSTVIIANCTFEGNYGGWGGGINSAHGCNVTLTNCVFDSNSAGTTGGGALLGSGTHTVTDCYFEGNSAGAYAGGMHSDGVATITNCTFYDNSAAQRGGGLANGWGSGNSVIMNCTFTDNDAGYGGGMYNYYYPNPLVAKIINCTFYNNISTTQGGAIQNSTAKPIILNCSFDMNSSQIGGAIQNESDSDPTITNCIFWGNTATLAGNQMHSSFDSLPDITYCDIDQDGFTFGNNIRQAPNWVGSGNFHLLSPSPCIDTGTNAPADLPAEDYEGNPRIYDGDGNMTDTVDMGADEYLGGGILPSVPSNPSPSDTASGVSVTTNLDWDDSTGADSYDVYFGLSSSPPYYGNTSVSQINLPELSYTTTYYWRVVAKNSYGSTSGPTWSFTTQSPALPGVPSNPSPSDGATGVSVDVDLDWDDSGATDSYDVYFGTSSPPPFVENLASSSYSLSTLEEGMKYYWKIVAKNIFGDTAGPEWNFTTESAGILPDYYVFDGHDFDGDGDSDVSIWRPSNGRWYIMGVGGYIWGTSGDIPVNGDYNGDGTTDIAVWRPSNGRWYIRGIGGFVWGTTGDIPIPGDYNGDGTTDIAVWRPSNGRWYIRGVGGYVWGTTGDFPVPGDYNGDGTTDVAVWRPSNGRWYIRGIGGYVWGTTGDFPVPGDYNGDGTIDVAVWRPSNGRWYIRGVGGYVWGTSGDIPVPGDYNGDSTIDVAVWRPSNGRWYIRGIGGYIWGTTGDIPVVR